MVYCPFQQTLRPLHDLGYFPLWQRALQPSMVPVLDSGVYCCRSEHLFLVGWAEKDPS